MIAGAIRAVSGNKANAWLAHLLFCAAALPIFLAGREAEASCGDYVVPRDSHSATSVPNHPDDSQPPRAPCNGPLCRGQVPLTPVPPAPIQIEIAQKPLALLAAELAIGGGDARRDWPTYRETARPGFSSPLLRPPSA